MNYDSDFGFLNSFTITTLTSANDLIRLLEYFMYHVNARSRNVVANCTFFTFLSLSSFSIQIASHGNHNYSTSSDPLPLKIGILISPAIFLLGGGWGGIFERGGGWGVEGGGGGAEQGGEIP